MIVRSTAAAVLLAATLGSCSAQNPEATRQSEVAGNGKSVMPFDLDKTTHRFTPRDDGLLQEVIADQPGDITQIGLIRQHLTDEATRFRRGDFADPARIHGNTMPGLAELTDGANKITIDQLELPNGSSLTFRTTDPALVKALHTWGEAQVSDHGSHAEQGTK